MKRIGNGTYYYRSVREGGQVRSEYMGRGELAEGAAFLQREAKRREAEMREQEAKRREESEAKERSIVEWFDAVEAVARMALMGSGYRQHDRGEWRKTVTKPIEADSEPKTQMSPAEVDAIQRRCREGDRTLKVAEVLEALDACPLLAQANGSPTRHLTDSLLNNHADSLIIKESVRRKLAEVQAGLEGPNPTPLERLLAERAAICWLTVNQYEGVFARSSRLAYREAEYQQRKIDAAHRRFLSAVKTLATVRKLGLPDIKINLAKNQVNVG